MSYHSTGSYYPAPQNFYQPPPPATPDWALAPVPGWGANPERSGPPFLAMNGLRTMNDAVLPRYTAVGDSESDANQGYIALAAAGGLFLGWFLSWVYWYSKSQKK
jgi:hypothetical protein